MILNSSDWPRQSQMTVGADLMGQPLIHHSPLRLEAALRSCLDEHI